MKEKIKSFFKLYLFCYLLFLTGCEAEKNVVESSENGKKMRNEITFEQFKHEIGQPYFSKKMSLTRANTSRGIEDFEVDTTLVKSIENNFKVYSMRLEPKFDVTNSKFYNLIVYKDNLNEIVKQIIEFSPNTELINYSEAEIFTYLQSATKEMIYTSSLNTSPYCLGVDWIELCNCLDHSRETCNGCPSGFRWVSHIYEFPCPSAGDGPVAPEPNIPGSPNDQNDIGGVIGGVIAEAVLPNHDQNTTAPCQDLKDMSVKNEFRQNLATLKTQSTGQKEKMKFMFNDTPAYSPEIEGSSDGSINLPNITNQKITGYMHCHLEADAFGHLGVFTPEDMIVFDDIAGFSNQPSVKFTIYLVSKEGTFALKINDPLKFRTFRNKMANDPDFNYKNFQYFSQKIVHNMPKDDQIKLFLDYMTKNDVGVDLYEGNTSYTAWKKLSLDENKAVKRDDC